MVRSFLRALVDGPAAPQLRRFVTVGTVAAGIQMVVLWLFVDTVGLNYLVGAVAAIEITIVFSYVLNNAWTFRASRNTGRVEYLVGLAKTNVVRGTAIPIQLAVLYVLVEWVGLLYLVGNAVGIGISGLYRYVFDARWTWG
ncbi:GtrA family protein [Halobacteriales archaeon Cl-PHB]